MSLSLQRSGAHRRWSLSPLAVWRLMRAGAIRLERASALRREFERMDDHMLSDIGVSRAQLGFELDRE